MHASILLSLVLGLGVYAAPIEVARDLEIREIERRQSLSTTRNDLLLGACKPVTVIFARGTVEPGNVGDIVGPPLFNFLGTIIGNTNVAAQGVDYPADVAGYLAGGSISGGTQLASLVQTAATRCPNTQIVLGGYSQGAQEVYLGAAQLSPASAALIKAVVLFGNPNNGKPVPQINPSNVITYCHPDDLICQGEPIVLPTHLLYGLDTPAAAQFIAQRVSV